jgi:hypothetical protein
MFAKKAGSGSGTVSKCHGSGILQTEFDLISFFHRKTNVKQTMTKTLPFFTFFCRRTIVKQDHKSGCGVAQTGFGVAQIRVRCGSDSSAPACCTAGPGSNLGSAPQRRPSTERKAMRTTRVVLYE